MKRVVRWLFLLLAAAGMSLLVVGLQRSRLPYNEADRYFDPEVGTVYQRQMAEVYTLVGSGMLAVASLFTAVSFRAARKDRASPLSIMTPAESLATLRAEVIDAPDDPGSLPAPPPRSVSDLLVDRTLATLRNAYLRPPASAAAIDAMQTAAQRTCLGKPVPEGDLASLRLTDGAQFDAVFPALTP